MGLLITFLALENVFLGDSVRTVGLQTMVYL